MPSGSTSRAKGRESARAGGARGDFVASLGRKVHDARELLSILEDDASSAGELEESGRAPLERDHPARDELRRRLHALWAGARLLRFEAMTHALQEALGVLDRGAQGGTLREQDASVVGQVLDDLPALAWGEVPAREAATQTGGESSEQARTPMPIAALVVGDETLADALSDDGATRARAFECERTDDMEVALQLARAHAPDVLVVDADLTRAFELVEALLDDPLTDPLPIVVVGGFRTSDDASRFVALGVAKTLTKPFAPAFLRATCDEVVDVREGRTVRVTLGEPTLEQLAERLSEELRHALVDGVDAQSKTQRVPLGEGTEVLGALWGAIARVQELVTHKTAGAIRFGGETPEGAIALAPWMHQDLAGADRMAGRGRGAAVDVRLHGRRVVVADDDPGVTWFVSDLLRTAGCQVHEALDGASALDLAVCVQPELVISDILMPGLDGFALCRALRRDVALRDTPVILLSWKEDLLQRVRELGASAAAYMRKESGSRAILARVREVLRPRARVEMRLRDGGEVRGRLDGLTPRLLLELVCLIRKDARIAVRDATHLYEVDVVGGAPRKATRTSSDGSYQRGERALGSLLGVGAGRFVVTPSTESIHGELSGTLAEQLIRPIVLARGALAATTGARTAAVENVIFDEDALGDYLSATPDPARSLIARLARGSTPRQMLLAGEVAPSLLEDILADLAARGAIRGVRGAGGTDLLTPAIEAARAVLQGAAEPVRTVPPNARPSAPSPSVQIAHRGEASEADPQSEPELSAMRSVPPYETLIISEPPPAVVDDVEGPPSSLEDAVMRELSDRALGPRATRAPTSDPPSIIDASELRRRSSNPPPSDGLTDGLDDRSVFPSLPPDAIVPAGASSDELSAAPYAASVPDARIRDTPTTSAPAPAARASFPPPADVRAAAAATTMAPTRARERRRRRGVWGWLFSFVLLTAAIAAVLYWKEDTLRPFQSSVRPVSAVSVPVPLPAPPFSPVTAAVPTPSPRADTTATADDLPTGAEVPPGFGLLEVRVAPRAIVRIDGTVAGSGPFVANVATPGYHEVRVEQAGRETAQVVEVHAGKATRVGSAQAP